MKARNPAAMPPIRSVRSSDLVSHDAYTFDLEMAADLPPAVDQWRVTHLEEDRSFRHQVLRSAGLVP